MAIPWTARHCPTIDNTGLLDLSGNGYGANLNGVIIVEISGAGGSHAYDGFTGAFGVSFDPEIPTINTAGQLLTLNAWVKLTSAPGIQIITGYDLGGNRDWLHMRTNAGWPEVVFEGSALTGTGPITDDSWHMVTFVADADGSRLFLDSVQLRTGPALPRNFANQSRWMYGNQVRNLGNPLSGGDLDDVSIAWDYAATQEDIDELWAGGLGRGIEPSEPPIEDPGKPQWADRHPIGRPRIVVPAPQGIGTEQAWWCPSRSGDYSDLIGSDDLQVGGTVPIVDDTGSGGSKAYQFDGNVLNYLEALARYYMGTDAGEGFGVTLWVKRTAATDGDAIGVLEADYQNGFSVECNTDQSAVGGISGSNGTADRAFITTAGGSPDDAWELTGFTCSQTLLYGIKGATKAPSAGLPGWTGHSYTKNLRVGQVEVIGNAFTGLIDDIRIHNRELLQADLDILATKRGA